MADIAQIGIRVDTSQVKSAKQDLESLAPAAAKADAATSKLAASADKAAASLGNEAAASEKVVSSQEKLSPVAAAAAGALDNEASAISRITPAANAAAGAIDKQSAAAMRAATAADRRAAAEIAAGAKVQASLNAQNTAVLNAAAAADRRAAAEVAAAARVQSAADRQAAAAERVAAAELKQSAAAGVAANTNIKLEGTMKGIAGQTGNIAAQFNDIGVQLAGGQSPFLIALQQGTQLNQIFGGQGLRAIIGGLGAAFTSLLNPVSLATIAIIGLGGTAIQYFTELFSSGEKTAAVLKEQADLIRGVAEQWGEAVPAIQAYIDQLDKAAEVSDLLKAGDILSNQQFDAVRGKIEDLNVGFAGLIQDLTDVGAKQEDVGKLNDAFQTLREKVEAGTATATDMDAVTTALNATVGAGVASVDSFASAFGLLANQIGAAAKRADEFSRAASEALRMGRGLPAAAGGPVFRNSDGTTNSTEMQLYNDPGSVITPTQRPNRELAGDPGVNYADASGHIKGARKARTPRKGRKVKSQAELFGDITEGADRQLATLKTQQAAVGLSAEAASRMKRETELLNQAQQKNVNLNDEQKNKLNSLAAEMASVEEQTRKSKEAFDFAKDATRGFIDDLRSGLESGKGFFESFGDAAMGVLDKIVDKLLNDVMDALFETTSAVGGAGSGGGAGGILGGLFSLFSAKGNVFNRGGTVQAFAKGGVVSRPTPFKFAAGGAFKAGVMGEAGPEAIMPLKRGPDGSLGVQMHNEARRSSGGGSGVIDLNLHLQDDSGRMQEIADQQIKTRSGELINLSVKQVRSSLPGMIADTNRRGSTR